MNTLTQYSLRPAGPAEKGKQMTHPTTDADLRLRPELAADWLLRTLLPELLTAAGHTSTALALRVHDELTAAGIRDRYFLSRVTRTLRGLRYELAANLESEWWSLCEARRVSSLKVAGGATRFRDEHFGPLNEITSFVARTAPGHRLGALLQQCVDLSINVIVTCADNDSPFRTEPVPADVVDVFQRSLADLKTRTASAKTRQPAGPAAPVKVVTASGGRLAFQARFVAGGELRQCAHRHLTAETAENCGRKLRSQWSRQSAA